VPSLAYPSDKDQPAPTRTGKLCSAPERVGPEPGPRVDSCVVCDFLGLGCADVPGTTAWVVISQGCPVSVHGSRDEAVDAIDSMNRAEGELVPELLLHHVVAVCCRLPEDSDGSIVDPGDPL
jgi:hypothetical protein